MLHPNIKQHKNTKPIISRQDYHFTQPWPSEGKTNKQTNKNSLYPSLHEAYTNHWINLMRAKIKLKKEFNHEALEKETSEFFFFFLIKWKGRGVLHKWRKILDKDTSSKKWRGNREIALKRIHNNDSKDYPQSWKYNGENTKIN